MLYLHFCLSPNFILDGKKYKKKKPKKGGKGGDKPDSQQPNAGNKLPQQPQN